MIKALTVSMIIFGFILFALWVVGSFRINGKEGK